MKINFLPKTKAGEWSIGLIGAFVVLLWIFFMIANNDNSQQEVDSFFDNLKLAIPLMLAGLAGLMALILGVVSIAKKKERAIAVYVACLIGLCIVLFALAEMFMDHT